VRGPRIAVVGTFDVENFGDLLFPLLIERELRDRLDPIDLSFYSYREKPPEEWPYPVRSLVRLPNEISDVDLLIVGAGHLVRFDKEVAPGYHPPAGLHHPTGYWLMPSLLAAAYGVPVVWNSVTVSPDTPDWARGLFALSARSASYVAVRDEPSLLEVTRVAGDADVTLIPDIAFGVTRLLAETPTDSFHRFLDDTGLEQPYVVVQPSPQLVPHRGQLDRALGEARGQGCSVLELPISPVLGDRAGLLQLTQPTVAPTSWPGPLLLAEIISRAEAVVARSLHLSVVAIASGVPVHRHRSAREPKYEALIRVPGVYYWDDELDARGAMRDGLGRTSVPTQAVHRRMANLESHWATVAALPGRHGGGATVTAELIGLCTAGLESLAADAPEPPLPRRKLSSALLRRGRLLWHRVP
jgi:lipopolysaccharide transport system ATP-binding protein